MKHDAPLALPDRVPRCCHLGMVRTAACNRPRQRRPHGHTSKRKRPGVRAEATRPGSRRRAVWVVVCTHLDYEKTNWRAMGFEMCFAAGASTKGAGGPNQLYDTVFITQYVSLLSGRHSGMALQSCDVTCGKPACHWQTMPPTMRYLPKVTGPWLANDATYQRSRPLDQVALHILSS